MSTISVSIDIQAEPGEDLAALVAEALERLDGLGVSMATSREKEEHPPAPSGGTADRADSEIWPDEWCDRVVVGMTTEGQRALRFMCEHGPVVSFAEMMNDQGLDPASADDRRVMGGRLSSFGHNLNRLPRVVRNPTNNLSGEYKTISVRAIGPFLAALDRYDANQRNE